MTDPRSALEAAREALSNASRQLTDAHKIALGGKKWGQSDLDQIDAALASLDAPEGRTNTDWRTKMIDVHKLASEYEFRGDAGDYTPTEAERAMLEDFGESLVASLDAPQPDALREAVEALERIAYLKISYPEMPHVARAALARLKESATDQPKGGDANDTARADIGPGPELHATSPGVTAGASAPIDTGALRELLAKANEPWFLEMADDGIFIATPGDIVAHSDPNHSDKRDPFDVNNFELIVAMKRALPALLDAIEGRRK